MPRFKAQRKPCMPQKEHENIDIDRLSSLPDNLLISILSLLPTSSVVATSVLSQRWRHLWTYLSHISFRYKEKNFHKFDNFITAVNHVISKLTSPKIHTFHLCMPFSIARKQPCSSLLAPIVHEICLRNPEVIRLTTIWLTECFTRLCHLPSTLLKTQSLVELKLSSFGFDFGADAQIAINLPNLKVLDIFLCDSHRYLMHTLFKSCPLLERLYLRLELENDDHHVDIIAPNLKFLTIEGYYYNYLLLIDAPMLVSLKTSGHGSPAGPSSVFYHIVKNLKYLQEAKIIVPQYHAGGGNDYLSRILALFSGISCARSLTFSGCFHDYLSKFALPCFPNLIYLRFDDFDLGPSSWMPSCWLKNIRSLEIFSMKPDDNGIKFLKDILSNATILEQLHVSHYGFDEEFGLFSETRGEEYVFAMKLFKLPRSSSNCQIKLSGNNNIITASCEDFRHAYLQTRRFDV